MERVFWLWFFGNECAIEVEINSNSCKFESSDLEIGCGCRKIIFSNEVVRSQWIGGSARNGEVE